MLLLLSYNRHMRMISEALELRVECRRVNHMSVVSHGYGGVGGGRDGGGMHGKARWVGRMSAGAEAFTECVVKTLMTPDHASFQVCSSG